MDKDFARPDLIGPDLRLALQRRSDIAGLRHLGLHAALICVSGAIVHLTRGSFWLAPALIVHGVALIFVFAPLHETIHRTAFASRWLNDAVARVCGTLILLPADYFRYFHFAHHRQTQDPKNDPELAAPKPRTLGHYLLYVSGWPYWRGQSCVLVRHALGRVDAPFIPPRGRPKVVREARVTLVVYGLVAAGSIALGTDAALIYWVIPILVGQPALRLYLLAEHTGCPEVPDMLANSRTTLTNPLVRFLAWNMPYHVEHHLMPAVPFHRLAELHVTITDKIEVLASGYIPVHRELIAGLLPRSHGRRAAG